MSYRVLLVDDEPLARERLKRMLEEHQDFSIVGEQGDGEAALTWLQKNSADLVLMDIQMPGLDGMAAAASLKSMNPSPMVVFCTAYEEHALEAFGVDAVDYLLKPVRRDDLARALGRVSSRLPLPGDDPGDPVVSSGTSRTHLSARTHQGLILIPIEDVFYFVADQKYVNVVHKNGETLIDDSLRQLEDEFGALFVRVHRSALVARSRIVRLEAIEGGGHKVHLRDYPQGVNVSRRHLADLRKVMKGL